MDGRRQETEFRDLYGRTSTAVVPGPDTTNPMGGHTRSSSNPRSSRNTSSRRDAIGVHHQEVLAGQLRAISRKQAQEQETRSKRNGSRILLRGYEPLPPHGPEHGRSGQDTPFVPWPEAHTGRKGMGPPTEDRRCSSHWQKTTIKPSRGRTIAKTAPGSPTTTRGNHSDEKTTIAMRDRPDNKGP